MQGIVNGIDYTTYNPQTDSKIYMNYDASNFRKKKYVNKERLQEELGLEVDKKKYMIGLISRLTDQKGGWDCSKREGIKNASAAA